MDWRSFLANFLTFKPQFGISACLPCLVCVVWAYMPPAGATTFSFDYFVTDISVVHLNPPAGAPPSNVPTMPIGSRLELEFDLATGSSTICQPSQNMCERTIDNLSLTGMGFSFELSSEPLISKLTLMRSTNDASLFAQLDFVSDQFAYFGRSSQSYTYPNGAGSSSTIHDRAFARVVFALAFDPVIADTIDLSTVELTADILQPFEFVSDPNDTDSGFSQHLQLIEYFDVTKIPGDFARVSELARSIFMDLSAGGANHLWRGGTGDFGEETHWSPIGIPGNGTTVQDVARIVAPGTYSVSGAPDNPLGLLVVGNDSGTVTLEPILGVIETAALAVDGPTRLEFGKLETQRAVIAENQSLTVGASGVFEVLQPNDNEALTIDGTLTVENNGKVRATSIRGAGLNTGQAQLSIVGPTAMVVVDDALSLGLGNNSIADLFISEGAELTIGDSLDLSGGELSIVTARIEGVDTLLRGDSANVGIPFVTIGSRSLSDVTLTAGAELTVSSLLALGLDLSAFGKLQVGPGASVRAPTQAETSAPLLPLKVNIGVAGRGEITVRDSGSFLAGSPTGESITFGSERSGNGSLSITDGVRDNAGEFLVTAFEETIVGHNGTGLLNLENGARWRSSTLIIGEQTHGTGEVGLSGEETQLEINGDRLLIIGGDGEGLLQLSDGASLVSTQSTSGPSQPFEIFVGFSNDLGVPSAGRLQVDGGASISGGADSYLYVGAQAQGGTGFALFNNDASGHFENVQVGLNSTAPGVSPDIPVFEIIGEPFVEREQNGPSAANFVPVESLFAPGTPADRTGHLVVAGGARLDIGAGFGALEVGSRGHLQVESGATIHTGVLSIGRESEELLDALEGGTLGENGLATVGGSGTRIDAKLLTVGDVGERGTLEISDNAVVAVQDANFHGSARVNLDDLGVLIAENEVHIGSPQELPEMKMGPNDNALAEDTVIVTVGTSAGIVADSRIVIGDDTRAGAFEPLVTNAVLLLETAAFLITDELTIANGGALRGAISDIQSNRTEVLAGGIMDPGQSPGTLRFSGDVVFQPGSTLILEIGGTTDDSYDRIIAGGEISGATNLDVRFIDGFAPTLGEQFKLFDSEQPFALSFDAITVAGLADARGIVFMQSEFGSSALSVIAVDPPSAVPLPPALPVFLLALLSSLGPARRRRHSKSGHSR